MKKLMLIGVLFVLLFNSCASMQSVSIDPFEAVVNVADMEKDTIFVRVNSWMVDSFKNADSVIQFSDKDAGIVKGKYITPRVQGSGGYFYDIESTITIEVRDGRYKISMDNPSVYYVGTIFQSVPRQSYKLTTELAEKIKVEWAKLAQNLENSFSASSSDW